jgi:DNA-binding ferritin-like protein
MNKLKGLKEKRNDLVSKQKTMLSTAIDETRSLTEEEDTELRSVIEQIKELETEIETMEEEIRTSTIVINDENDKGEDKMTKTYEEIRSEFIDGLSVPNKELAKTEVRAAGDIEKRQWKGISLSF